jgi:drug/metabolite transporter (DMT)-like permease
LHNKNIIGVLKVALAASLWGVAYPLTKGALNDVPPILLGTLRFGIAGILFCIFTNSKPLSGIQDVHKKTFIKLSFWGVFILVLGMNFGLLWAPGIAASILSGTPPLFTIILARYFFNEKISLIQLVSIIFALLGLGLLGQDSASYQELESWKIWAGCLLTLIPQFAWAMYGIIGKKLSQNYSWKVVCRDTFCLGSLMLLPFSLLEVFYKGVGTWNLTTCAILFYLAILNSVVTYSLWNSALSQISVSLASFIIYLQPISGAIVSWLFFKEYLGLNGGIGALLIFVALGLVLFEKRKKSKNQN